MENLTELFGALFCAGCLALFLMGSLMSYFLHLHQVVERLARLERDQAEICSKGRDLIERVAELEVAVERLVDKENARQEEADDANFWRHGLPPPWENLEYDDDD